MGMDGVGETAGVRGWMHMGGQEATVGETAQLGEGGGHMQQGWWWMKVG
jgi:hypothetical protein